MDFRSARQAALSLAFAVAVTALAPSAAAQAWKPGGPPSTPPGKAAIAEAKERYKKGLKLYQEDGAIDAALIELERAYDLAPNHRILYNIGQAARSQPDYVTALRAFERYLADGGREVPAARRKEVEKEIADLRERVATITVVTNLEGATITLNDLPAGTSPLSEPLLVNAGRHKVVITKDALTATKVVTVAGKDTLRLELPLEAPKEPPPTTPPTTPPVVVQTPTPPPAPPPPPKTSYTWIGWVATGAFAVGAGVTGGLAIKAAGDLKGEHFVGAKPPESVTSAQSSAQTFAVLADIFTGAAVISFGFTLGFTLAAPSSPAPEPANPPAPASAGAPRSSPIDLRASVGPRGLQVGGTF